MFSLPNLLTAGNLLSGVLAILLAVTGRIDLAPYAVFLGLIFDFLDGFAARMLKKSGELGKQLDSLADMITFGVAPGVIMMGVLIVTTADPGEFYYFSREYYSQWIHHAIHFQDINYLPLVALVIPFFALFRLAKFNIDTRQSDSFIGLPTPANTLFFMSFPLALGVSVRLADVNEQLWTILFDPWLIAACIIVLSVTMVIELPLFSLKFKHFKFKGNEIRYFFLLISLGLILFFKVWAFALIVFLYLILSLIENTFFKKNRNEV